MTYTPKGCGDLDHITFHRLQRTVESAGHALGLRGDCFADIGSRIGTQEEELRAVALYLSLPAETRRSDRDLVRRMARSIVLTHNDGNDANDANDAGSLLHSDASPEPPRNIHPAIARAFRENLRASNQRGARR
jgi:hypothetical protein